MIKHYLKVAFRSIFRDKGYSSVNIIGLSIAIACCFLLIFWIKFELSYENCYPNANRIYRILVEEKRETGPYYSTSIRPGIVNQLKSEIPEVQAATYVHSEKLPFVHEEGKDGIICDYVTTNIDFLKLFSYEYVEGNPTNVAKNKGCVMSEETAKKFFGNESAIGKTVSFGHDGYLSCTIEAVVKIPANTQVKFDILSPSDRNLYGTHYIMVKENVKFDPNKASLSKLDLAKLNKDNETKLIFQPLKDVHLHSPKDIKGEGYGDVKQIYLFSLAALLILIVAVINYVNTSIARSLNRMKEVGVRKVTGSTREQLIVRFLMDSFIISLISAIIALILVKILFPDFSSIMGNKVSLAFDIYTILITILFCIIVSLLAGGYAAFYLSTFNPVRVLRGGSQTGSKEGFRKVLIGLQFFLSISILTCTLIMYKQINTIFNADTGVDKDNIIVIESSLWYQADDFIQVIKKENPNVIDASIALCAPYNAGYAYSGVSWEGSKESEKKMEFAEISCDYHYANTFGLEMVEGEFIPPGLSWWQYSTDDSYNIVINETFKQLMGVENPIGITVTYSWGVKGKIIGVVKDFNFKPLREKITPLIMSYNPEQSYNVYVKTTGKDKQATLDYILAKYKEMYNASRPDTSRPVMYHTVNDDYNNMYAGELRMAKILSVFSIISLLLSIMGIVSMISFMIEKRTKEIAIRRINGAEITDIIRMFIKEFSLLGIISTVLSIPVCYIIMNQWLSGYVYRTALSWWLFLGVPALILLITALVIGIQVFITARRNPVESLRSE